MTVSTFMQELLAYQENRGPVTIGLAGAGQMGTDIVVQVALMQGLRIGAVAEIATDAAISAIQLAGHDRDHIVEAASSTAIDSAIEAGNIAVTDDLTALASAGRIDVVIDATGNPNIGAVFALEAIRNGKHIVMLNVESDITIGRHLRAEAEKAGVVYSLAAGDEPACAVEIIGFAESLGLEIVAAGKGKNNPLNFNAIPDDYIEEARARDMNPRMLVEFIDGSKAMIEMVAIGNATGLIPDKPGMHGPKVGLEQLAEVLCPQSHGGLLSRSGCVDYTIGPGVAPGVFCIVKARHPRILERLVDLKVGKGPFFTIYRHFISNIFIV